MAAAARIAAIIDFDYDLAERAAIMEIDGGLSRQQAEMEALQDLLAKAAAQMER